MGKINFFNKNDLKKLNLTKRLISEETIPKDVGECLSYKV